MRAQTTSRHDAAVSGGGGRRAAAGVRARTACGGTRGRMTRGSGTLADGGWALSSHARGWTEGMVRRRTMSHGGTSAGTTDSELLWRDGG
jgi:hypothetical protein